jgi:predicted dehydrogenase
MGAPPLRAALLGAGRRTTDSLAPIARALPGLEPVCLWSRSPATARAAGGALGLPASDDLGALVAEHAPDVAIVAPTATMNGQVSIGALRRGMHVLTETPVAWTVDEADGVIAAAEEAGRLVEVAEQFHRRPLEALKRRCLDEGVFGAAHTAFVDSEGHGYHGASLVRSLLSLDARVKRVIGLEMKYPLADPDHPEDFQQHGLIELETGQLGVFRWSGPAYFSRVRPCEGSRFLAERGGWRSVRLGGDFEHFVELLGSDEAGRGLTIEREAHGPTGTTLALHADLRDGSGRRVTWTNPFADLVADRSLAWSDDTIAIAECVQSLVTAIRTGTPPSYGPVQARRDLVVCEAMGESARTGGAPVECLGRDRKS